MYKYEKNIALITGVTGQDGSYIASCPLETTSFKQLVQITVKHDMEKVAAITLPQSCAPTSPSTSKKAS